MKTRIRSENELIIEEGLNSTITFNKTGNLLSKFQNNEKKQLLDFHKFFLLTKRSESGRALKQVNRTKNLKIRFHFTKKTCIQKPVKR